MRVFDCFCFFQELDLLEIRLSELDSVVDHFVICEVRRDFKNRPKPLHLLENMDRFKKWSGKIRYLAFDSFPNEGAANAISHWKKPSDANWAREWLQRDALTAGVFDAAPQDLIMVSDLDEIPNSRVVADIVAKGLHKDSVIFLENKLYFNRLNWFSGSTDWLGTRMIERKNFVSAQHLKLAPHKGNMKHVKMLEAADWHFRVARNFRNLVHPRRIPDAGWHFSAMGSLDQIILKAQTLIDPIPDLDRLAERSVIADNLQRGISYRGYAVTPVDLRTLPSVVGDNLERYKFMLDLSGCANGVNDDHA